MTARPCIGTTERRDRLARRHHVAAATRVAALTEAVGDLVALHGTDPATVYLSAFARLREPSVAAVERPLYEDRSLVRMLGMRRTMFIVGADLAPVVQASSTTKVAASERRKLLQFMAESSITEDPASWLAEVEESAFRALAARGSAVAAELVADEPRLGERLVLAAGTRNEARASISSRVLFLLGADGRIVRGRPRGSWTSSQYRWSTVDAWLARGLPDLPTEVAQADLAARWLRAFGPGTAADLKWWTGWTVREVTAALFTVGAVEVDLDGGGIGLVLPDDVAPVESAAPWAALLPALDPTVMGWSGPGRGWFLGDHVPALFDRNGNAGPTVWWDGRVVGGWAQRADGRVVHRLLEDVGAEGAAAVEDEVERMAAVIGPVVVIPRFRTPLERELVV